MLPKERVIAALEFRNPDRIPTGEIGIDFALTEQALGHPTLYRAKWREYTAIWQGRRDDYVESCKRDIVALAHKFDHDIVPAFLVPSRYRPPARPQFISQFKWRMPDGRVYVYSPETQGNAFIVDGPRPESVEEVPDRAVDVDESQLELIQHLVAELGDTHFVVARPPDDGIFPHDAYEMQWLLSSMAERPEVVERVIAVESSYYIEMGKLMLDAGCDAVITHNDVAGRNGPFMSPSMFRRFCWPWLKAWADMAHTRGKYFFKHTDGNTWKILDLMIAAGVDAWHGIQPSIGMTLPELQAQYGGRLCFWGGVDLDTLIAGSEDQVENEVRAAIESSPTQGGLILGAGNAVMVGVRLRNYLAMMRAARAYRSSYSRAARLDAADVDVLRTMRHKHTENKNKRRNGEMKKSMQAVVLHGVNDLRMEELPVPQPGPGQVLIKNKVAGVCGTDVHMWGGTNFEGKFPFIPGHEWVGEVVELGPGVTTVKRGDRVTGECFVPCHVCDVCKVRGAPPFCPNHTYFGFQPEAPGAMAEYTLTPEVRLHKIPASLSDDEAALVEPVSVAYHAVWGRGGGAAPHDRIGVFGAGPIGLFATQIALVSGAQVVVVEPAPYRQQMARTMGAETIIDPTKDDWKEQIMDLTEGLGFTLIVECSGNQSAIASSVDLIAVDGRIVLTGQSMGVKVPVELGKLIWTHGQMVGSCDSPGFWPKAIAYIARKRADVTRIITHRFPLAEAPAAFEVALKGVESGKVVLDI